MKTVMKFVADDGKEFEDMKECVQYETLCARVHELEKLMLSELPVGTDYIQQNRKKVLEFQRCAIAMLKEAAPWASAQWEVWMEIEHPIGGSHLGRVASEQLRPIAHMFWRLHCMDREFRKFSQPFYAIAADKGRGV